MEPDAGTEIDTLVSALGHPVMSGRVSNGATVKLEYPGPVWPSDIPFALAKPEHAARVRVSAGGGGSKGHSRTVERAPAPVATIACKSIPDTHVRKAAIGVPLRELSNNEPYGPQEVDKH